MWVIICTIFFADTYATLYSLTLNIWGGKYCYVQDEVWVKSLSTFVERFIHYNVWLFPVIWIFWPPEARCNCGRKLKHTDTQRLSESAIVNGSVNDPIDDDIQTRE